MKYLTTILKKIIPKEIPKPVGRWNIEQCNNKVNYKVDLSNEDHCGPCGQYALTKLEIKTNDNNNKNSNNIRNEKNERV
jgi:hypothetical protein